MNVRFQAVIDCVEQARQEVLSDVKRKRAEKRKILDEQINIIQAEKAKVDTDIQVLNWDELWFFKPRSEYRTF